MRRLAVLLALAALAWTLLSRRRRPPAALATIGYDDGSQLILEAGSPDLERLALAAEGALAA
jgi:hypothetical protein